MGSSTSTAKRKTHAIRTTAIAPAGFHGETTTTGRLVAACSEGNAREVRALLLDATATQVNQAGEIGETALYVACTYGHLHIVHALLGVSGILVNAATTDDGSTPLGVACAKGHLSVVRLLLGTAEIQPNQADDFGLTPLFMACRQGHVDMVRLLLRMRGINIDQKNQEGDTALVAASRGGHSLVARLLKDYNARDVFGGGNGGNGKADDDGENPNPFDNRVAPSGGGQSGGGNTSSASVHFLNGASITFPVHAATTIKDLHAMVSAQRGVKDGNPFSMYEIFYPDAVDDSMEEFYVNEEERVLDVVENWQKMLVEGGGSGEYLFLYKARVFAKHEPEDPAAMDLFYAQAVVDVVNAKYPAIKERDAVMLAALQMQERHGDYAGEADPVASHLPELVEKALRSTPARAKQTEASVLKVWQTLAGKGYTARDAKHRFLEQMALGPFYGSAFFDVEVVIGGFPKEAVLAMNAQRLCVLEQKSGRGQAVLATYKYDDVLSFNAGGGSMRRWRASSRFEFVVATAAAGGKEEEGKKKIVIQSEHGKDIDNLMQAYMEKFKGDFSY